MYLLSKVLPRDELYGLTSQMRRAATSIPANIAEGYGRESRAAYGQFLKIARGSLRELETHLIVIRRLGLAAADSVDGVLDLCDEQGRILHALITRVGDSE